MRWFRSNVRLGSRLALFALAIQFALSFGHFHDSVARAAPVSVGAAQSGLSEAAQLAVSHPDSFDGYSADAVRSKPGSGEDPAGQPPDDCAICAVMALAHAMVAATAPDLQAPQAAAALTPTIEAGFVDPNSTSAGFQPRAPPVF
jgi:hypothetical protein